MQAATFFAAVALLAGCAVPTSSAPSPALHPSGAPFTETNLSETRTLYVSPTGDDSNPGTQAAPFKTIEKASNNATPGTTVRVAPGTYTGSIETTEDGTSDARIAYVSEAKWGAKLVGDGEDGAVWRNRGDYVDIVGFDITGPNEDGGLIESGSNSRIAENYLHDIPNSNCLFTYSEDYELKNIDIIGNVVHGCGSGRLDHGMYPAHTGGTISNNISYGNSGFGIHCWHACNELTISNNVVFNNEAGGILVGQGDAPNYGDEPADNMVVSNNIVVNNGHGIEEYGATGSNNVYLNNNVFGNKSDGVELLTGREAGTIASNPDFVNYQADGSGDYRLKASSPNVNAGTLDGAPTMDIVGNTRPAGTAPDIGIYEIG
jgi:hypothetical protein